MKFALSASRRGALLAAACRSLEQRNPRPLISDAPVGPLLKALLPKEDIEALEHQAQLLSTKSSNSSGTSSLVDLHAVCTQQLEYVQSCELILVRSVLKHKCVRLPHNDAHRSFWVDRPTYPPLRTTRRQVVLLGAGMDTRPFRLGFSRYAHTVFEVDGDEAILHAKHEALVGAGFRPRCGVKLVGADTSDARAVEGALSAAGFDPRVPTRWVLESEQPSMTLEGRQALFTLAGSMCSVAGSGIASKVLEPSFAEQLHKSAVANGIAVSEVGAGDEPDSRGALQLPSAQSLAPMEYVLQSLHAAGWKNVRHVPLSQLKDANGRHVHHGVHLALGDADVLSAE